MQNHLLPFVDLLVSLVDRLLHVSPLDFEFFDHILLLFEQSLFVLDCALECLELLFNVGKLVLRKLYLTFRGCRHLDDLVLIIFELLLNELLFSIGVFTDLTHGFLVIALHCSYVLLQECNELILLSNCILVILLLRVDLQGVLFVDFSLSNAEFSCFVLLLLL